MSWSPECPRLPAREADGCYHPATESELAALIRQAHESGTQLRVMGSTHSVWRAIVTDQFNGPLTPAAEFPVVLDRYVRVFEAEIDPSDPQGRLVEVQAGCHIGLSPARPTQARIIERPEGSAVREPSPWHDGAWSNSLTATLHHRDRLALPDLGGISHQTVAGYVSTGSSGGTVKWSIHDAIARLRVIDASGRVVELTPDGDDPDWFYAAGLGMGLCGVISTITFRCIPAFDIVGRETISATRRSSDLDFYGDRPDSGLPSLEQFLIDADYARLMWWPQRNFDRLVVWQARRAPFEPQRQLHPYRQVGRFPVASQVAASIIYTVLGNLEEPDRAIAQVNRMRNARKDTDWRGVSRWLQGCITRPVDPSDTATTRSGRPDSIVLGAAWVGMIQLLATAVDAVLASVIASRLPRGVMARLRGLVPKHIDEVLSLFVSTGKDGAAAIQEFCDRGFMGLPLDNQMDDLLMPTWFTELWVPFTPGDGRLQDAITRLRRCFDADGTARGAYAATGAFAFELYVAKRDDKFFLSPASGSHAFRVDVFWFGHNRGNPVTDFYPQFWNALEPLGYRLHWGKFLPAPDPARPDRLTVLYPSWKKWQAVRDRVDPKGLFLTRYWREHLGLTQPIPGLPRQTHE
ncbi:MAG: FAD-binding protein [Cyanobacteria bacterium]|nr:FAD-binding protein [Cyanobacteriota bacterium]